MAKIITADTPLSPLDTSGLPAPTIDLPELQGMFGGQDQGQGGMPGMPPDMGSGAPPMPGMGAGPEMPTPGSDLSPAASIASKMGKNVPDPEGKAINLISSSIRTLNQLADTLLGTDETNAKTVRQIIRILGEILKNAKHGKLPPPPAGLGNQPVTGK